MWRTHQADHDRFVGYPVWFLYFDDNDIGGNVRVVMMLFLLEDDYDGNTNLRICALCCNGVAVDYDGNTNLRICAPSPETKVARAF